MKTSTASSIELKIWKTWKTGFIFWKCVVPHTHYVSQTMPKSLILTIVDVNGVPKHTVGMHTFKMQKCLHLFLDANVTWGFDIYSEYSDTQMSKSVLIFMFQLRSQQSWEHIVINMLLSYNAIFPFIESLPASTSLCCLLFGTTLLSVSSCPVIRAYNILIRVVFSFYY